MKALLVNPNNDNLNRKLFSNQLIFLLYLVVMKSSKYTGAIWTKTPVVKQKQFVFFSGCVILVMAMIILPLY